MNKLKKFAQKYFDLERSQTTDHKEKTSKKINYDEKQNIQVFEINDNLTNLKSFLKMLLILKSFEHTNLMKIRNSVFKKSHAFLDFKYMDFTLTQVLLQRGSKLTRPHIKYIFYQIVLGVNVLHKNNIQHQNLKSQNIFISDDCQVKIGKFNKANPTFLPERKAYKDVQIDYFTAPEVVINNNKNSHCRFKSDIWALGCIFFELLEGKSILCYKRNYLEQLKMMFKL